MKKTDTHGVVIFYDADYETKTIKEIGRTPVLEVWTAMEYYAETPNPASQIITFSSIDEQAEQEKQLQAHVNSRKWLNALFECI